MQNVPMTIAPPVAPVDRLDALLRRFGLQAELFHSGPLCGINELHAVPGRGHVHVVRRGRVDVHNADGTVFAIDGPVLLFYPRPLPHRFITDPDTGADMACATIAFGGGDANPIPRALPACMRVPLPPDGRLAATVALLFDEAFDALCGRQLVVDRLFEVLLVQLLRHALAEGTAGGGLLAGLAHPRLRHALVAMHEAPQRAWTLEALAGVAGMSRTRFAGAFRDTVGTTPADYLTGWRIAVAQDLLRRDRPMKQVAADVGYESPAALARAFKARLGVTPRDWRRTGV